MFKLMKKETVVMMKNRIDLLRGRIHVLQQKNEVLEAELEKAHDWNAFTQKRIERAYNSRDELHEKVVGYRKQIEQQQQVIDSLRYEVDYLRTPNK